MCRAPRCLRLPCASFMQPIRDKYALTSKNILPDTQYCTGFDKTFIMMESKYATLGGSGPKDVFVNPWQESDATRKS